ncbi:hypothetical protein AJ85_07400 [Alkalihalobacillus alcalophilus ATCC 27647 = CGMCC 1.3604]|uniref:Uncharacterized protein n=1 Tax=Alkalihalobacillus alcalophilus ATCC 27647 = CGMCC 1.3604 TaxID=1218173 RepID=A0A094XAK5_ALKAL|nr:hypothetical protein BALCAV_0220150 [Alkalihalobacillus alcalophilus ATCC 27647 = CGMCC 1.3604]THG91062.1 hypothetical protein AJ85_07400 [Alkalihalobacillus alcalophilus ATCC 27647 = CGMCC 1.3604]
MMIKKFGYSNLIMLAIGIVIMYMIVDFKTPDFLDLTLMVVFGLTILLNFIRFIYIYKEANDE